MLEQFSDFSDMFTQPGFHSKNNTPGVVAILAHRSLNFASWCSREDVLRDDSVILFSHRFISVLGLLPQDSQASNLRPPC